MIKEVNARFAEYLTKEKRDKRKIKKLSNSTGIGEIPNNLKLPQEIIWASGRNDKLTNCSLKTVKNGASSKIAAHSSDSFLCQKGKRIIIKNRIPCRQKK